MVGVMATDDDVTRDPAAEADLDEVWRLAAADARGDIDPRVLTGELAYLQDEYDAKYTEALVEIANERGH